MSHEDDNVPIRLAGLRSDDLEFLDTLIERFLQAPIKRENNDGDPMAEMHVSVTYEEIYRLCALAVESFRIQSALIRISRQQLPITICGDIHGQFRDLRVIIEHFGSMDKHNYLFLGDFGDRGIQGIETVTFLLANKIRYPQKCYMLRGNHEDYNTSMIYGMLDECLHKYGNFIGQRVWLSIVNVYNHMPFAALVADKIFALHGGLSPHMKHPSDINRIPRPTVIPLYGLACDLVWADPNNTHEGWALSSRGISFTFDEKLAERFCQQNGIDLIVRGHQIYNEMHKTGYQFTPNQRVLTLFTASDYLRTQNTGATLTIDTTVGFWRNLLNPGQLTLSFTLFRPISQKRKGRSHVKKNKHHSVVETTACAE